MGSFTVDAGELRHKIEILNITWTKDAQGYQHREERVIRTPWAKVTHQSGTEQLRAGAEVLRERLRFLVRWSRTEITEKMVVRYQGREYEIEFVNPYGGKQYIELWCHRTAEEA